MTVDLIALHAPIMVTRLGENETAKSGIIIIPDTAKEKPEENEVLDIGSLLAEEEQRVPLNARVSDKSLFGEAAGNDIQIDDQGYLILRGRKPRKA